MKSIILAAGMGNRLGEIPGGLPKCLIQIEGESLLKRNIKILEQNTIKEILVVTGYRANAIHEELKNIQSTSSIKTVNNPEFTLGSVISLWTAKEFLQSDDDIILMDADVLYHPLIMNKLVMSMRHNIFLLDREFESGDEPVKLCVHNDRIVDFRKRIDKDVKSDFQGESVGFFRFSSIVANKLLQLSTEYKEQDRKNEPYEEVIRDILLKCPEEFSYEDITDYPWIEIDFPEDVERANKIIIKQINEIA